MRVAPLYLNFFPGKASHKSVKVTNLTGHTIYLKVGLFRVVNPGTPKRRLVTLHNDPMAFGLIASPRKLVIPAHQVRSISVLRLHTPHHVPIRQDWVYQINVTPMTGALVKSSGQKTP